MLSSNKICISAGTAPELNLIEVNWSWLQRQAINNATFKDEQEIGRAVSKWKDAYNKNHGKAITNILQRMYLCVYITVNQTHIELHCPLSCYQGSENGHWS